LAVCQIESQQLPSLYVEGVECSVHLSNTRDGLSGRCDERCNSCGQINLVQIVKKTMSNLPG
jgi:hypothetical protein